MIPYRKDLKPISRTLRSRLTESEQTLWARLRRKQLRGTQFYRQKPLGGAIVDFYAPKAKLVIEIDGSQHVHPENIQKDRQRSAVLAQEGLRVLRFDNLQVLQDLDSVVEVIVQALLESEMKIPPNPPLSKGG